MRTPIVLLMVSLSIAASAPAATSFSPREFNVFLSGGASQPNRHGQSKFRTIHFEINGQASPRIERWIHGADLGLALTYSDIRQDASFYPRIDPQGQESVRGEYAYLFTRWHWRNNADKQPYLEVGSGPMLTNRRVPATTLRFNFHSQLGLGMVLRAYSHTPLRVAYRFSHISNLVFGERNPGLNVHTVMFGVRLREFRRQVH